MAFIRAVDHHAEQLAADPGENLARLDDLGPPVLGDPHRQQHAVRSRRDHRRVRNGQDRRAVDDHQVVLLADDADELLELGRGEDLGRVGRLPAAGEQPEVLHARGRDRVNQLGLAGENFDHAGLGLDAEHRVDPRAAEVAVNEQDPLARLGERDGQVGGHRGLAVTRVGAGDLDHAALRAAGAETQRRPQPAKNLGKAARRAVRGDDRRIDRRLGAAAAAPLALDCRPGHVRHDRQPQRVVELVRAAERLVAELDQVGQAAAEQQPAHAPQRQHERQDGPARLLGLLDGSEDLGQESAVVLDQVDLAEPVDDDGVELAELVELLAFEPVVDFVSCQLLGGLLLFLGEPLQLRAALFQLGQVVPEQPDVGGQQLGRLEPLVFLLRAGLLVVELRLLLEKIARQANLLADRLDLGVVARKVLKQRGFFEQQRQQPLVLGLGRLLADGILFAILVPVVFGLLVGRAEQQVEPCNVARAEQGEPLQVAHFQVLGLGEGLFDDFEPRLGLGVLDGDFRKRGFHLGQPLLVDVEAAFPLPKERGTGAELAVFVLLDLEVALQLRHRVGDQVDRLGAGVFERALEKSLVAADDRLEDRGAVLGRGTLVRGGKDAGVLRLALAAAGDFEVLDDVPNRAAVIGNNLRQRRKLEQIGLVNRLLNHPRALEQLDVRSQDIVAGRLLLKLGALRSALRRQIRILGHDKNPHGRFVHRRGLEIVQGGKAQAHRQPEDDQPEPAADNRQDVEQAGLVVGLNRLADGRADVAMDVNVR